MFLKALIYQILNKGVMEFRETDQHLLSLAPIVRS